jgi:hypothetical protein
MVDGLQVEFLIHRQQVHIQHQQIPPHTHHLCQASDPLSTPYPLSRH